MTTNREPVATFTRDEPDLAEGEERPAPVEWAKTAERAPIFSYQDEDGARVDVTMPAKPNPGLGLQFLRVARQQGPELAVSWLIEEAIGTDGYDVLIRELSEMPDPENGQKVLSDIGQRVQKIVMGGLTGPKA